MTSPLLGFMEFSAFCHYHCPEVECLGGCIDKLAERNTEEGFKMDRLIRYYHRLLGGIEGCYINGYFWIYADMHYKKRFETLPIWKRYRREHGES